MLLNSSAPPFDNILARRAVAHAIDYERLNSLRNQDIFTIANGPFAPGNVGHIDDTGFPTFDQELARDLVEQYEAETGLQLTFTGSSTSDPGTIQTAQVVQQMLAEVGIETSLRSTDQATLINEAIGGQYQAHVWRNHPGGDPDEQYIWWHSGLPTNFGKFSDPEIDRLLDEGRVTARRGHPPAAVRGPQPALRRAGVERLVVVAGVGHRLGARSQRRVRPATTRRLAAARDARHRSSHGRALGQRRRLSSSVDPVRTTDKRPREGSMAGIGRRLIQVAVVLLLVTLFTAMLTSMLRGDPVEVIAPFASDEQRENLRAELGLDDPLPVRYVNWLTGFVTGDLGNYYAVSGTEPVAERVADTLPVSLQLMLYAQVLALLVAIPMGVLTAYKAGSWLDKGSNGLAFAAIAIPNFALGLLLSYYVGVKLGWLPFQSYTPLLEDPVEHFRKHGAARHHPGRRTDRDLPTAPAQRRDRHPPGGLRRVRQVQGSVVARRPVPARPPSVEPDPAHRGRAQRGRAHRRRAGDRGDLRVARHRHARSPTPSSAGSTSRCRAWWRSSPSATSS